MPRGSSPLKAGTKQITHVQLDLGAFETSWVITPPVSATPNHKRRTPARGAWVRRTLSAHTSPPDPCAQAQSEVGRRGDSWDPLYSKPIAISARRACLETPKELPVLAAKIRRELLEKESESVHAYSKSPDDVAPLWALVGRADYAAMAASRLAAANKDFDLGDEVEVRDKDMPSWRKGIVTNILPLKVTLFEWDQAFEWDEIRCPVQSSSPHLVRKCSCGMMFVDDDALFCSFCGARRQKASGLPSVVKPSCLSSQATLSMMSTRENSEKSIDSQVPVRLSPAKPAGFPSPNRQQSGLSRIEVDTKPSHWQQYTVPILGEDGEVHPTHPEQRAMPRQWEDGTVPILGVGGMVFNVRPKRDNTFSSQFLASDDDRHVRARRWEESTVPILGDDGAIIALRPCGEWSERGSSNRHDSRSRSKELADSKSSQAEEYCEMGISYRHDSRRRSKPTADANVLVKCCEMSASNSHGSRNRSKEFAVHTLFVRDMVPDMRTRLISQEQTSGSGSAPSEVTLWAAPSSAASSLAYSDTTSLPLVGTRIACGHKESVSSFEESVPSDRYETIRDEVTASPCSPTTPCSTAWKVDYVSSECSDEWRLDALLRCASSDSLRSVEEILQMCNRARQMHLTPDNFTADILQSVLIPDSTMKKPANLALPVAPNADELVMRIRQLSELWRGTILQMLEQAEAVHRLAAVVEGEETY